ncbi:MAG: AAA family ATPase [Bacilli bacterium]|nr:AAA family ATPase [Bacilli bacterium]
MGKIIAIVGMCGSGKSVASDYLVEKGYKKVYFGGVTMEKLKENNMEITPENEKYMREKLREELGMAAYAKILLPRIIEYAEDGDVVLDGLYSWDEYVVLKEKLGDKLKMIAIIATRSLRYSRLNVRDFRPLTNEEAESRDISEIENLAKGGPIAMADYFILNDSTKENYINSLENILNNIK